MLRALVRPDQIGRLLGGVFVVAEVRENIASRNDSPFLPILLGFHAPPIEGNALRTDDRPRQWRALLGYLAGARQNGRNIGTGQGLEFAGMPSVLFRWKLFNVGGS